MGISKKIATISATFAFAVTSLVIPLTAQAAVQAPSAQAKVSFTFDDSLQSTYTNAEPILAQYGLTGTDYAITGCVGMSTVPNTCRANTDTPYMTWAQLQALQNSDGWEIGSHTVDHDCLASSAAQDPSDCQTNTLTQAQVDAELANSQSALAANGINATDFAPPYGDYNNMVLAQIAKYYQSMRQFKNASNNLNYWPYSDYYLQDFTVLQKTDPVATVESQINTAIADGTWLVLTFHNILPTPSNSPDDYEYGTAELAQIAAYVQSEIAAGKLQSVHVDQGLVTSSTNLFPNSSFSAGIADGWTTDDPTNITGDSADNGAYPNPTYSVKLDSNPSGTTTHLFSPQVAVTPGTTYMLKNFLNVQNITSGEVGFYIDEYDANGNWISGQWKAQENSSFVESMNFSYKPSSAAVSKARLQVIVAGKGITAYLDNPQMFPLTTATQTDLLPNSTFDAGIADGWNTDAPTYITADGGNNGSPADPVNSIKLTSSTSNVHLFSPKVAVSSAHSYSLSSYLNLKQIGAAAGSEIGFYIDEYNSAGTWISGQYKTGVHTVGAGNVGFSYTPSSSSVASASLQVIVVGNSNIVAYLDDADWYQN